MVDDGAVKDDEDDKGDLDGLEEDGLPAAVDSERHLQSRSTEGRRGQPAARERYGL